MFLLSLTTLVLAQTTTNPLPHQDSRDADGDPAAVVQQPTPKDATSGGTPQAAQSASSTGNKDIVVRGRRQRGAVASTIPPERTFNNLDVRSYGATTINELIQTLGTQVTSGRGRSDDAPVVLLNGRRVSSFAEIARIPTEAIERMDVFPEEVALAYGYRADQKVVNVVTYERFVSKVAQISYARPTQGGQDTPSASADFLRIRGDTRISLGADYTRSGALLESERGIEQVPGADPASGRFRTLLPSTSRSTVNGTVSGSVLPGVASTFNGRFEGASETRLFGLGASGPLASDVTRRVVHGGTTQAGRIGDWLWTLTGNFDRSTIATTTDRLDPGRDDARLTDQSVDADLLLTGSVLDLPAGAITASARAGVAARDFSSRSLVSGVASGTALSRDGGSVETNVDVPVTASGALGQLSVNGNARLERLSGFGTLHSFGYGVRWSPMRTLDLRASFTNEQGVPTVEQQGGPTIVIPNARVFDVARGEAVDVTRVFGGNPDLTADERRVFSAGVSAKPFGREISINIDYVATRVDDPIAAFPLLTPVVEEAFPDRFTRDASGRLLSIDSRPLNFTRSRQQQLRSGLNWSRPLGAVPAELRNVEIRFSPTPPEPRRNLPPGTTVQTFAANSPQARLYQNLSSRLFVNVQHIWRLEDAIVVREGVPALNLVGGDAIGLRGGRPRHELELQVGAFKRALGAQATISWQSGTSASGLASTPGDPEGQLDFGSLITANLLVFANIGDHLGRARSPAWLRGTRVTLGIVNLFNTRPDVRDSIGTTPLIYQPAYVNPLGRVVSFSLRKVF